MDQVNLYINDTTVTVDKGTTVLQAAEKAGYKIPTLCYFKDQSIKGNCRVCLVEIENHSRLETACSTLVKEGMKVKTNSKRIRTARQGVVELILANHNRDCLACHRNQDCELQTVAEELNIFETPFEDLALDLPVEQSNPSIVRDETKCIKCGRCVEACNEVQTVGAIYQTGRSTDTAIKVMFGLELKDSPCVYCGQCVSVCPVGALHEKNNIYKVWEAIEDKNKHVVVQIAPSVRVALGEEIGFGHGALVTGKIVSFLKKIGVNRVFDSNFTADLTIMEEGHELLHRLQNGGSLPMLTSCSPGWINFIETYYPSLTENLSTCKSPQQMFGTLIKTYYAEKEEIDPKDIYSVSIMPCTAKKAEAERKEMNDSGYQDVDVVLTTRELASMMKQSGINLHKIEDLEFDNPLGISTGAGQIFGASGGVMEAALRTVYEVVTGKPLENLEVLDVRGMEGIKEAVIPVGDLDVKVAVASGLGNARKLMEKILSGEADYHFIEIMTCPGGCIGGGGQPRLATKNLKEKRIDAIYEADRKYTIRKSHQNPAVHTLYKEFLGKPLGEIPHKLLHTHYGNKNTKITGLEK